MAHSGVLLEKSPSPPTPLTDWGDPKKAKNTEANDLLTQEVSRLMSKASNQVDASLAAGQSFTGSTIDVTKLVKERDEMWKEHAHRQILFVQEEHCRTLSGLHQEIQRLQNRCFGAEKVIADLTLNTPEAHAVDSEPPETLKELSRQLADAQMEIEVLKNKLLKKDELLDAEKARSCEVEKRLSDELDAQSEQIKRLTAETVRQMTVLAQSAAQISQLKMKNEIERGKRENLGKDASSKVDGGLAQALSVKSFKFPYRISMTVPCSATEGKKAGPGGVSQPLLPPIDAKKSANALIATAINIEKPAGSMRPATITTKTTFRTSLKRNNQQKSDFK